MAKFQGKYRIESARLKGWDYSKNAGYFITGCTANRVHYFGEIQKKEMIFSELGHIAEASWLAMLRVFPVITEPIWKIMPNHFHVLFFLNNTDKKEQKNDAQFGPLIPNSVSSIINHFKGRVTKYANNNQIGFSWQERFYDHIVRDEAEYQRIANYIIHNPKNWENDKFFS